MNKNYTLKELADIGAEELYRSGIEREILNEPANEKLRTRLIQAILDAIGYEFPKDEEREAFERWEHLYSGPEIATEALYSAWKAGREELRRLMEPSVCAANPDAKPKEPAWIPWNGGQCPLPDTVKKWQYRIRMSNQDWLESVRLPSSYLWTHENRPTDIIAYRVLE